MTDRQPDFVIVGATKSATTWLQRNLQQHSAIFMPGAQTHYFSRYFEQGPAWYGAIFAPAAAHQIVGERSTSYLDHPEAPRRLREALPDARLIVQLRSPIERALAHYRTSFRHDEAGTEGEREDGALDVERLHAGGLYFRHIARFLELFPREQLYVSLYDDLDREPARVLHEIRTHIGLARGAPASVPGELAAAPPGRAGRTAAHRSAHRGKLARAQLAHLCDYYREDVEALSQLLGRDLSFWLGPTRSAA